MKTTILCSVTLALLSGACASDNHHDSVASADEVSAQVAFYGLTVMDCQQQASQCVKSNTTEFFAGAVSCSAAMRKCLAKAGSEIAKGVVDETKQVAACGTSGVECLGGAHRLSVALACENDVESCVVSRVNEVTGIPLPTTQQVVSHVVEDVGEVVETLPEVVHTAAEVTHQVVDTTIQVADHAIATTVTAAEHVAEHAVEVADETIETTAAVADHVIDTTANVAVRVVDAGAKVTTEVVGTAAGVVTDVVDTTANVAKSALQCGEDSRTCIRTTKKLLSCQFAYADCMSSAL